jgi:hypothetical protein
MVLGIVFPISYCRFRGGETLHNFQARFPGTVRIEQQLLYENKGQSDRSIEANQTAG